MKKIVKTEKKPTKTKNPTKRTWEEGLKLYEHYMYEIHDWARLMDRILFRKNLILLAEFLEEESVAMDFTPASGRNGKQSWQTP